MPWDRRHSISRGVMPGKLALTATRVEAVSEDVRRLRAVANREVSRIMAVASCAVRAAKRAEEAAEAALEDAREARRETKQAELRIEVLGLEVQSLQDALTVSVDDGEEALLSLTDRVGELECYREEASVGRFLDLESEEVDDIAMVDDDLIDDDDEDN